MNDQLWSWILAVVGLVGFILAGKKVWWCWYINIGAQFLWLAYGVISQQYGFIVSAIVYAVVFTGNARKWTKDHKHSVNIAKIGMKKLKEYAKQDIAFTNGLIADYWTIVRTKENYPIMPNIVDYPKHKHRMYLHVNFPQKLRFKCRTCPYTIEEDKKILHKVLTGQLNYVTGQFVHFPKDRVVVGTN